MNREELERYILEKYPASKDYPWEKFPNYEVFRHLTHRKWFAVIMDVPREKLGLEGNERIDVVNLKCDSRLIGSLCMQAGFFPAYHMSKESWITVALGDTVSDEEMKMLLDISFEATGPKRKKK